MAAASGGQSGAGARRLLAGDLVETQSGLATVEQVGDPWAEAQVRATRDMTSHDLALSSPVTGEARIPVA